MTRISPTAAALVLGISAVFAILLGSCHSGSPRHEVATASTQYRGDLDGDGLPSVADAIGIMRIVVGLDAHNPIADADGDGAVTVNDAIAVLRCVVGLDDWPLGVMNGGPTRTIGPGTVTVTDFVVGADERVQCLADTIIECQTATIAGELFSSSPTIPGENAGSITIEAQGDVLLTGALRAGNGSDGDLSGNSGRGGDGGSVTINSANGDITIGAEAAVSSAGPSGYLGAGDAGVGADDLLTAAAGAGGQGGSVTVSCPNGLLTIRPRAGLIHIGNGGDGGTGHIPAESEAALSAPADRSADGGPSGLLSTEANELRGIEEDDDALLIDPPDLLTGGNGGNGGSLWLGVEVGTDPDDLDVAVLPSMRRSGAVRPVQAGRQRVAGVDPAEDDEVLYHTAAPGGDAVFPGAAGVGGESCGSMPSFDHYSAAEGGPGGNLRFNFHTSEGGTLTPWISADPTHTYRGAPGGVAVAHGFPRIPGLRVSECAEGPSGTSAYAKGGKGGAVVVTDITPRLLERMLLAGGTGGFARASAGHAMHAGHCCDPTSAGRGGGDAGARAIAEGGEGGDQVAGWGGYGGPAVARGQRGGAGGDGSPPGIGGSQTQTVSATSRGGTGTRANGLGGTTSTVNGERGANGERCPGDPEPESYGLTVSDSDTRRVYGHPGWYTPDVGAAQAADFTLGGSNNPLLPPMGASIIFAQNNAALWASDELSGKIVRFADPLTGGDRAPGISLGLAGLFHRAIWYQESRDIVYASTPTTALIYAWDGASGANGARPPTRQIEIAGYGGGAHMTGAPSSDRLFISARVGALPDTRRKVLVYDNAHTADGAVAPSRAIEPTQDFRVHGIAWDDVRDVLYLLRADGVTVDAYASASTINGSVSPSHSFEVTYPGMPADDRVSALVAAPLDDLLFVSTLGGEAADNGHVLVYRSVAGTPVVVKSEALSGGVTGLGIFRQ